MKPLFLLLVLLVGGAASVSAAPWAGVDVPLTGEDAASAALEGAGIPTIGWSNAVAEVSEFKGLALRPVADLVTRMLENDPRRDPWLQGLEGRFRPSAGTARLWVPADRLDQALKVTGGRRAGAAPAAEEAPAPAAGGKVTFGPRSVTGLLALAAGLLILGFGTAAVVWGRRPPWAAWRQWLWVPAGLLLVTGGLVLSSTVRRTAGAPVAAAATAPGSEGLWRRHVRFQQIWPYGGTWTAAADPSKAWNYPTAVRSEGHLAEAELSVAPADPLASGPLDPHHAARLDGVGNP